MSLIDEQEFLLRHIVGLNELSGVPPISEASAELVQAILQGVADFAEGAWAPLAREGDTSGARWTHEGVRMPAGFNAAYQAFVEAGWSTLSAPTAFGGQGLPFSLSIAAQETLGTANFAFALCPMLTTGAMEALLHHGSADQQAIYLPRLATGEWTGTMNLTEPQAGTDVGALRTKATLRTDGNWSISGTKIFISFGDHDLSANIIHLVLARTPNGVPGTKGISLFLVPKYRVEADGTLGRLNDVRAVSIEHKLGLHASPTCMLSFGENGECIGELVGAEFGGMAAMFTMMNNARLNVGLQGVQAAESATRKAIGYASERVQSIRAGSSGREPVAIIEHPDVRRMLMRMKALTQAARALVYYAAGMVDRSRLGDVSSDARLQLLTPLVKAYGTDIGMEVANLGIQVHGGMGFIEETGATQFFRDVRVTAIYEGTNGIQASDLVGRKLTLNDGKTFDSLIEQMRTEAKHPSLVALIDACADIAGRLSVAAIDDRLAASYPFMTMLATAVAGWLMERQGRIAEAGEGDFMAMKRSTIRFYLDQVVPEAMGLVAAATASAEVLYSVKADGFAA